MTSVKIDNKEYSLNSLSEAAKVEMNSIKIVDQKLAVLQSDLAIFQTARNAYHQAFLTELPAKQAHPNKKKDVINVGDKKYAIDDISENAKAQLTSLQATEQRIAQLQADIAIAQTARNAYAAALRAQLAA